MSPSVAWCIKITLIHKKNSAELCMSVLMHCYLSILKTNNVITSDVNNSLHPVIIDFSKSTTLAKGKLYKLSLRDQEKYRKYHKHIAPEL